MGRSGFWASHRSKAQFESILPMSISGFGRLATRSCETVRIEYLSVGIVALTTGEGRASRGLTRMSIISKPLGA